VTSQTFALATSWSHSMTSCGEPQSGILGFAMQQAAADGSPTVVENLYNQGKIDQKVFSVSLKNSSAGEQSVLIIGEPDTAYYTGNIVYSSVYDSDYGMWFTSLDGFLSTASTATNLDSSTYIDQCSSLPCVALLDTGTSLLLVPDAQLTTLKNNLISVSITVNSTNRCQDINGTLICPKSVLNSLPTLWFEFGGYALPLKGPSYFIEDDCNITDYACLAIGSSFEEFSDANFYILGDVFLRQYYVIFDESYSRIGFASMNSISVKAISSGSGSSSDVTKYIEYAAIVFGVIVIVICLCVCYSKWRNSSHDTNDKQAGLVQNDNYYYRT